MGTIILIIDIVKHKGLINSLRELNDRYELAKKKGDNAIESITAASRKYTPMVTLLDGNSDTDLYFTIDQLDSLMGEVEGVKKTIDNAIKSVDKMQSKSLFQSSISRRSAHAKAKFVLQRHLIVFKLCSRISRKNSSTRRAISVMRTSRASNFK